jgi:hypothetical protein
MSDKFPTHEWINTGIAFAALLASGAASWFTWQDYQARQESVSITTNANRACTTDLGIGDTIDLCWSVWISNTSASPLSLVGLSVEPVGLHGEYEKPLEAKLETWEDGELPAADGKPLVINLDPKKTTPEPSRVRVPIHVPPNVVELVKKMPRSRPLNLGDIQKKLIEASVDITGQPLDLGTDDTLVDSSEYIVSFRSERGKVFTGILTFSALSFGPIFSPFPVR